MQSNEKVLVFVAGDAGASSDSIEQRLKHSPRESLKCIAELQIELPQESLGIECCILDDYRDSELTIRNAAEAADGALKAVRPVVGESFSHRGKSLWRASETDLLHFHLLRTFDYIAVLDKLFEVEKPDRIYCVGTLNGFLKIVSLVAAARKLPCAVKTSGGRYAALKRYLWTVSSFLSKYPKLHLLVWYLLIEAKSQLTSRQQEGKRDASVGATGSDCKSITLLGTDVKQLDIVYQLYRYLTGSDGYDCRILALNDNKVDDWLREKGVDSDYLPTWPAPEAKKSARRSRSRFFREGLRVFSSRELRARFQMRGVSTWPVTGEHLMRSMLAGAPHMVSVAEQARAYFQAKPADVVVTPGEWNARSRACVIAAQALGGKAVSVQRGDITNFPGWGEPVFSDRMTVNGPAAKEAMVELQVESDKIIVTGDPRMDPWVGESGFFQAGKSREALNIPAGSRLIAVMTNPVNLNEKASHAEEYITALLEAGLEIDSLFFVIKLHPSEFDLEFYERLRKKTGAENVAIIKEFNTPQLLYDADVVVTTISTTGEEAIFLGKPLLVMNLANEPDFMPYAKSDAAITVRERGRVKSTLSEVLENEKVAQELSAARQRYVERHMYRDDGQSCARCADVITKCARGEL